MNLEDFRANIRAQIDPTVADNLDTGSSHAYCCRCEACRQWWKAVGPDDGDNYGPFTKAEIDATVLERSAGNQE